MGGGKFRAWDNNTTIMMRVKMNVMFTHVLHRTAVTLEELITD